MGSRNMIIFLEIIHILVNIKILWQKVIINFVSSWHYQFFHLPCSFLNVLKDGPLAPPLSQFLSVLPHATNFVTSFIQRNILAAPLSFNFVKITAFQTKLFITGLPPSQQTG